VSDNGEKSELPTGKRLEEASKRGQVPYSTELTAALMFLIVLGGLRLWGGNVISDLSDLITAGFSLVGFRQISMSGIAGVLTDIIMKVIGMLLPIFTMVLAIVLTSGFLQVGVGIRFERVKMRWSKLNPATGVKKLMSLRSVFTVALALLKVATVLAVVRVTMDELLPRARDLTKSGFEAMSDIFVDGVFLIGFRVGALILILAILDLLWTRFKHTKDLMMSKQEVKEEHKEAEGNPEIKGKIKAIQKQVALSRMMKDVKTATVVVRNPTHYAVALRYDREQDPSPRLVAKGRNLIALRIIDLAKEAGVPIRSDPPLARQVYRTVKLGAVIPEELFRAVARILAWVYGKKGREAAA
jgi:flagellar biosynthetic protein FlhB